jgi:hypothetical protein
LFGIGTTPALLALSLTGNVVSLQFKSKARRVIPVFIVNLGILFILRGMNLGIPYVSPKSHKLEVAKNEYQGAMLSLKISDNPKY